MPTRDASTQYEVEPEPPKCSPTESKYHPYLLQSWFSPDGQCAKCNKYNTEYYTDDEDCASSKNNCDCITHYCSKCDDYVPNPDSPPLCRGRAITQRADSVPDGHGRVYYPKSPVTERDRLFQQDAKIINSTCPSSRDDVFVIGYENDEILKSLGLYDDFFNLPCKVTKD